MEFGKNLIRGGSDLARTLGFGGLVDMAAGAYGVGQAIFDKNQKGIPLPQRQYTNQMAERNPFGGAEAVQRVIEEPTKTGARSAAGIASWMIPAGKTLSAGRGLIPTAVETIVKQGAGGALQALSEPNATPGGVAQGAVVGGVTGTALEGGIGAAKATGKYLTKNIPQKLTEGSKRLMTRWASWLGGKNSAEYAINEGLIPAEAREIDRALVDEVGENVSRKFETLNEQANTILKGIPVAATRVRDVVADLTKPMEGDSPAISAAKERFAVQADAIIRQATGYTPNPDSGQIGLETVNELKKLAWKEYGNNFFKNAGSVLRDFIYQETSTIDPLAAEAVNGVNREMHDFLIPMSRRLREIITSKGGQAYPSLEKLAEKTDLEKAIQTAGRVGLAGALTATPFLDPTARFMVAGAAAPLLVSSMFDTPANRQKAAKALKDVGESTAAKALDVAGNVAKITGPRFVQGTVNSSATLSPEEEEELLNQLRTY